MRARHPYMGPFTIITDTSAEIPTDNVRYFQIDVVELDVLETPTPGRRCANTEYIAADHPLWAEWFWRLLSYLLLYGESEKVWCVFDDGTVIEVIDGTDPFDYVH